MITVRKTETLQDFYRKLPKLKRLAFRLWDENTITYDETQFTAQQRTRITELLLREGFK